MLNGKQRAYLRSLANSVQPSVQIGKNGINDDVISQILCELDARELIKISVLETAMMSAREACEIVCERTKSEPVLCIGFKFIIYKQSSKEKNRKISLADANGKIKKAPKPSVKPGEKKKQALLAQKREKEKAAQKRREYFKKRSRGEQSGR